MGITSNLIKDVNLNNITVENHIHYLSASFGLLSTNLINLNINNFTGNNLSSQIGAITVWDYNIIAAIISDLKLIN